MSTRESEQTSGKSSSLGWGFGWAGLGGERGGNNEEDGERMNEPSSGASPDNSSNTGDDQLFGDMSWSTRIQGFLLFAALGFFANVLSWMSLSLGNYKKYAALMTIGNLMSLFSTAFLMGPRRQLRNMFDPVRVGATLAYLGSMLATFIAAFVIKSVILCSICCIVQYGAFIWYCLSYIPYGRQMAQNCLGGCLRMIISV